MPSAPVALSVNVSAGRVRESKSAEAETDQSPFGQVLAQEVSRQGGGAKNGESAMAASAQNGDELVANTSAGDDPALESTPQDGVVVPWLLMMQQVAQAAPTLPPAEVSMAASGEELSGANQGADVSMASLEILASQTAVSKTDATSLPETGGETRPGILAVDGDADVPLAANAATESGKALPQDVALAQEKTSFAEMFFERRAAKDELNEASWATPGQVAAQTLESGQQVGKVVAQHVVAEPVGESRWGDAVAQRVSMMLGKQEQQIDMQLNPPHLGPMEVRLTLGQEQASVIFTSQHAAVREALAAATPRLSALLADQGIQLVNVQVASDSLNQQAQEQSHQQQAATFSGRGQEDREVHRPLNELTMPRWSGEVTVPVARSGVSLYV